MTGGAIAAVARVDMSGLDSRIERTQIIVACDVTNPMTGVNGAAHIYGPQKGASPQQVELEVTDRIEQALQEMPGSSGETSLLTSMVKKLRPQNSWTGSPRARKPQVAATRSQVADTMASSWRVRLESSARKSPGMPVRVRTGDSAWSRPPTSGAGGWA